MCTFGSPKSKKFKEFNECIIIVDDKGRLIAVTNLQLHLIVYGAMRKP